MVGDDDDLFAGRYALGDVLGSGDSGVVRRAHDRVLDRPVALKLLRTGADDETLRARLRAGARLAGSLHHPGIARVYDYGEVEVRDEPTPYLVMQYVEGTSLRQLVRRSRGLGVTEVLDLVGQIADALGAAHAAGIVNRDLKSSNVLVTDGGRAVLVDLGLAGTIHAGQQSALSDLEALGLLAQECLTPLSDVPPAVTGLVTELMAEDPADRPSSAAEVAERARSLARGPAAWQRRVILPPPPPPRQAAAARAPVWRREALRSRRVQVSAAAVVVALIGTIFVSARPATTRVPDLEGMAWGDARQVLAERGLEVDRRAVDVPGAEKGTVLAQEPPDGVADDDGTVVVVEVASGKTVLDPDDVVGLGYDDAARVLVRLGLVPVRNDVPRPGGDSTVVTALPGGRLATGTMVTLTVGTPER